MDMDTLGMLADLTLRHYGMRNLAVPQFRATYDYPEGSIAEKRERRRRRKAAKRNQKMETQS